MLLFRKMAITVSQTKELFNINTHFMTQTIKETREQLKGLSNIAKEKRIEGTHPTINSVLVEMYAQDGAGELHSLDEWNRRGYLVKKGEKALLLWGKPKTKTNETGEYSYFPVAYVFSEHQVEPMKKTA